MPNRADQLKPNFVLGGYLPRTLDESAVLAPDPQAWMGEALRVSMNAVGWSAPNPAVGCVLVKNGQKVAEGFTQAYRHEHAEKMLFQQISPMTRDWSDAELYVTLEPCSHYGHQPPCLDLILNSTIKTIHVACVDPDDRVSGKSIEKMTLAGK